MVSIRREENRNVALFGVSSVDGTTPTPVKVNPSTGAMLIDGTSLYATLDTRYLNEADNLSDLDNVVTARTNLGLGSIALLNSIDISANTNLAVTTPITLTGDTVGFDVTTTALTKYLLLTGGTLTGPIIITPTADSTALLKITDSENANNYLNIDTSTSSTNSITDPSVEAGITQFTARAGATLTQDATQFFVGTKSLKVVTTATANAGVNIPVTLSGAQNFSFMMRLTSGSFNTTSAGLFVGYAADGVDETTTLSTRFAPSTTGWWRISFSFTPAATSGTPYLFIKQENAAARTFYLDAFTCTALSASNTQPYYEGKIELGGNVGIISKPIVMQPTVDTTAFFSVLTSGGRALMYFDTIKGSVEVGTLPQTTLVNTSATNIMNITGNLGFITNGTAVANTAGMNFYNGFRSRVGVFFMEGNTLSGATGDMYFANTLSTTGSISFRTGGLTTSFVKFYVDCITGNVGVGQFDTISAIVPEAKFHIKGASDQIQHITQAYNPQTSWLHEYRDFNSVVLGGWDGTGKLSPQNMNSLFIGDEVVSSEDDQIFL